MRPLKYILILLIFCLLACNKYDIQPEQADGFIKFFSTGLTEVGFDVKPTDDGGYVAVGTTADDNGIRDIYLVRTDKYGNEESWSPVVIGGELDDVATSLQVVSDGFVILGYSNDASGSGGYDMYLVKTDLQGNVLWEQRAGGPSEDRGTNLELTSDGGFLAAGTTSSFGLGTRNAYWVTFNSSGNITRSGVFGVDGGIIGDTYIVETASDFVACGSIETGRSEIFVSLINKQNLVVKNFKYIGTATDHYGKCIQELADGNLILCGSAINSQGFSEVYLQKLAPDLNSLWVKIFSKTGESSDLNGNAIRIAPDNGLAILGTKTETENDDLFLLLTDSEGNELNLLLFGDDGYQRGSSLEITASDNGFIIVGTNGFEDNSMMALIKTDGQGKL